MKVKTRVKAWRHFTKSWRIPFSRLTSRGRQRLDIFSQGNEVNYRSIDILTTTPATCFP
jgi:hypothetical protein